MPWVLEKLRRYVASRAVQCLQARIGRNAIWKALMWKEKDLSPSDGIACRVAQPWED